MKSSKSVESSKTAKCEHDYKYQSDTDMERETYVCSKCGDFYRLYYDDMK